MPNARSKFVLGSANFGLTYGIANKNGKLDERELAEILTLASNSGIHTIDTAQAYGDSERRLGALIKSEFQVISKFGVDLDKNYKKGKVTSRIQESLDKLSLNRLSAALIHRPELLFGPNGSLIAAELKNLKEAGVIESIGISIYSPDILAEVIKLIELDIVQVPFNLFDRRIVESGWSERLKNMGIKIHTRSTFLQGLLLMKPAELPAYFSENWAELFGDWFAYQKKSNAHADEIALNFALQQPWVDKIVVGVDNALQLDRLLQIEARKCCEPIPSFNVNDVDLIEPFRWRL